MIHKFHDLDRDGNHDPGEPMLEGIPFDITANKDVHHRTTDRDGLIQICFEQSMRVGIVEQVRQTGGLWNATTRYPSEIDLECGQTDLWIGNAPLSVPNTGLARAHRWSRVHGPWHMSGADAQYD